MLTGGLGFVGFGGSAAHAALAAAYADDVGYSVLQSEIGSVPDGSGIALTIVEACASTNPCAFAPDPKNRNVTDGDGGPQVSAPYSGHATGVANRYFGNDSTSQAPGIAPNPAVAAYEANAWIQNDFLNFNQRFTLPDSSSSRIANHSWVGATGVSASDTDLLRRIDWLVEEDNFIQVVGFTGNSSPLFGSGRNVIAVNFSGTASNNNSRTVAGDPAYATSHVRPDLVAPDSNTSRSVARVSSAATLLASMAANNASLSNGSTTNRENDTIRNAGTVEVIKAALMAGAERAITNTYPTTNTAAITDYRATSANQMPNGLDRRYGAGQLNIYNSYQVIAAGEQESLESNGTGNIGSTGFDYDPAFGGSNGSNTQGTYFFTTGGEAIEFVAALVWNLRVDTGNRGSYFQSNTTLYDLDLNLYDTTDGGNWVLVASSTSGNENTENIRAFLDADTPYALQVVRGSGQSSFNWDYGIAWRSRTSGDIDGDGLLDVKDLMLIEQAINGITALDQQQRARADVYPEGGDGKLDVSDLLTMQRMLQTD